MTLLKSYESELYNVSLSILQKVKEVAAVSINTPQDAMLNLRIDWESLETCLRNRKVDGFEPAVNAMQQLAATALSMSAILQSKILNQRIKQMDQEEEMNLDDEIKASNRKLAMLAVKKRVPVVKKRRKRKVKI